MNEQIDPIQSEVRNPHNITVTRSILNKGKVAKANHAFFVSKATVGKRILTLTTEVNTLGLNPISELATKGRLIEQFLEHYKKDLK